MKNRQKYAKMLFGVCFKILYPNTMKKTSNSVLLAFETSIWQLWFSLRKQSSYLPGGYVLGKKRSIADHSNQDIDLCFTTTERYLWVKFKCVPGLTKVFQEARLCYKDVVELTTKVPICLHTLCHAHSCICC